MMAYVGRGLMAGIALMCAVMSPFTTAQDKRPMTLIVAYPPGGASDVTARLLAERLGNQLNRTIIVENKSGADGTIAMQALAKAPADGSVLGFAAVSPLAITPHIQRLPFSLDAIAPLSPVMYSPVLYIATPALDVKNLAALVARARKDPGRIRAAGSGSASLCSLALHQLQEAAGVTLTLVPYKGGGQLVTDAIGGQFEIMCINANPSLMQSFSDGKLTPLAVGAPERLASLPNVPTLQEAGYPQANRASVFGLFMPAGVPAEVAESLNEAINAVLQEPDFKTRLTAMGNVPMGGTARDFAQRIREESQLNEEIVQKADLAN